MEGKIVGEGGARKTSGRRRSEVKAGGRFISLILNQEVATSPNTPNTHTHAHTLPFSYA